MEVAKKFIKMWKLCQEAIKEKFRVAQIVRILYHRSRPSKGLRAYALEEELLRI